MPWIQLLLIVSVIASGAFLALYVGYVWGRFAALQALQGHASKWKAYLVALVPPLVFALTFHFDSALSPIALRAFFGLGAPAAIGVCIRYHAGLDNGTQAV